MVLDGRLGEDDTVSLELLATFELLQATVRPAVLDTEWIHESIHHLIDPFNNLPTVPSKDTGETSLEIATVDPRCMYQRWEEQTSSLPPGYHLDHYKAILDDKNMCEYPCIMSQPPPSCMALHQTGGKRKLQ